MAQENTKLFYFELRGRAEPLRLLFAAAGQPYEDCRLSSDAWSALKSSTPFGQLPCLEIDGVRYGQTVAIGNYIARKNGLYGKSNLDALKIDQVVQLTQDFIGALVAALFEKDESKKQEYVKKLKEVEVPKYLSHYEALIGKNGHVVGSSVTLADITVYDIVDNIERRGLGKIEAYSGLQQLVKNVENNEKIKAYLATRKPEPV